MEHEGGCSPAGRGREQRETGWICLDGWDVNSEGELRAETETGRWSRRRRVEGQEKEDQETGVGVGGGEEERTVERGDVGIDPN